MLSLVQIPYLVQEPSQHFYGSHSLTLIFDPMTSKMSPVSRGPSTIKLKCVSLKYIDEFRRYDGSVPERDNTHQYWQPKDM